MWPSEIIRLNEGATQYDCREGFRDVGASRTGIKFEKDNHIVIGFAEVHEHSWVQRKIGPYKHLVALTQDRFNLLIVGYLFLGVELIVREDGPPRGEASMLPAKFHYNEWKAIG